MARQIAKDHEDKRDHIKKTAAIMFAAEGCSGASMSQVAQACNISKANIYHYYPSKTALIFAILDDYLSNLWTRIDALSLMDCAPEDQLRRVVREVLLAYEGADAEHQIQTEGLKLLGDAEQQVLKGYQRNLVQMLSDIVAATAPNLSSDPLELRATTMSVFGMLNWFYMWHPNANSGDRIAYANTVVDLVLSGIRT